MYRILLILLIALLLVSANSFPASSLDLKNTTETLVMHCGEISYIPSHYDTDPEAKLRKEKGVKGDMVVYIKVDCKGEIYYVDGVSKESIID